MFISDEQKSKFAALHRQWWRLQMSWKIILEWEENLQTNKQLRERYNLRGNNTFVGSVQDSETAWT